MQKTVLQLLQEIANELGLDEPTSIVNTRHRQTKQLLALLYRAGQIARDKVRFAELNKTATITLVTDQADYDFPDDCDYELFDTHWIPDKTDRLYGPISPETWQAYQNGAITVLPLSVFKIKGYKNRKLSIFPVPTSAENGQEVVFEYQSKQWILPPLWAAATLYRKGGYVHYGNNVYKYNVADATKTSGSTAPTHTSGSVTDGGIDWLYVSTSYDTALSNEDIILLPEQVINAGVQMLFRAKKALPFQIEAGLFEAALNRAKVNSISAKTIYLDGNVPMYTDLPDTLGV